MSFLWSSGALIWDIISKGTILADAFSKAVEAYKQVGQLKNIKEVKNGADLDNRIHDINAQRVEVIIKHDLGTLRRVSGAIITNDPLFSHPIDVDMSKVRDMSKNPDKYGMLNGQLLREARNLYYYQPDPIFIPFIMRDSNGDRFICHIPKQVIQYNFLYPWETPLDLTRLEAFGITSEEIMPEVTHWFKLLGKEDQVYFSQLYKNYYQLARAINQIKIANSTQFFQELFTKRDKILRESGASMVSFDLKVDTDGSQLKRVYVQARAIRNRKIS